MLKQLQYNVNIRGLTILAILCLSIVIIIDFTPFKLPELIKGTADNSERLIYTLTMSYMASYIFYFLNVYLRERKEKKAIYPLISKRVLSIIINNQSIIDSLKSKPVNSCLNYLPSQEEFKDLLRKINPKDNAPKYFKDKSWTFLFQNRRESTLSLIDKILASGKHIDEELRSILLKLDSSLYLKEDYAFNSDECKKDSLEEYSLVFFKYFELIQDLNRYFDRHLKSYYLKSVPKNPKIRREIGEDAYNNK